MKAKKVAANQTEITLANGNVIFVSYETPVAAFISGRGMVKTTEKWSNTTTRHISAFHKRLGWDVTSSEEPQEFFNNLLKENV